MQRWVNHSEIVVLSVIVVMLTACGGSSGSSGSSREPTLAGALPQQEQSPNESDSASNNSTTQTSNTNQVETGSQNTVDGPNEVEPGGSFDPLAESATSGASEVAAVVSDPEDAGFVAGDKTHFVAAMQGAWMDAECKLLSTPVNGYTSTRAIHVFAGADYIVNQYSYVNADCTGIPYGEWYPLKIHDWNLGGYRLLSDGSYAWELDYVVTQRGLFRNEPGPSINTRFYDIVQFSGGQMRFGNSAAAYSINRPDSLAPTLLSRHQPRGKIDLQAEDLWGAWVSDCVGRLQASYEFDAGTLVITDENWADVGCEGDSYAVRRSTFNIIYGETTLSNHGDTLLLFEIEAVTNELIKFDASTGFDEPDFKVPEGKTEYRAVSVDQDNTLILGYCLIRNSGEDDCQDSPERAPDMVDYNWNVRFTKIGQ